MRGFYRVSLAACLIFLATIGIARAGDDAPPEPPGYWNGPMLGPVPETISGGTVVDTRGLSALMSSRNPVLIDVLPAQRKPDAALSSKSWMPLPHRSIPGAVWIPGAGNGTMPSAMASYVRDRLRVLTGGDFSRPVVLFCKPDCWMSWNAAKRVVAEGYQNVYWYPDGIDAWQNAGLPTEVKTSEGPEADPGNAPITRQGDDR